VLRLADLPNVAITSGQQEGYVLTRDRPPQRRADVSARPQLLDLFAPVEGSLPGLGDRSPVRNSALSRCLFRDGCNHLMASTGTPDAIYDLILVLQQALEDCKRFRCFANDGRDESDAELADFFQELGDSDEEIAERAKSLLIERLR